MSDTLIASFLSKILPRAAGILAGYLVGEAAKHGLTLDPEQITALMLVGYAFVHRLISKYTNPGDATKSAIIDYQKAIVRAGPLVAGVSLVPGGVSSPAQIEWEHGQEDGVL